MNKAVIVLVLTTAAASLACMHLVSELHDERARTEALQTRITELERAVVERAKVASAFPTRESPFSPFSTSTVEHEPEPSTVTEPPALAAKKLSATPAPDRTAHIREHFARQRELMQDPKYRETMRKQQRVHMDGMYPGLAEALGLSAEEKGRFLDLLSQQRAEEMANASESMVWNSSDAQAISQAQEAFTQRQQRYQQELEQQFGPNVRQQWTEYQETLGQRHRVAAMQSQLALAGAPLNAEQSKAMLNAFVEEQRRQIGEHVSTNAVGARGFVPFDGAPNAAEGNLTEWIQNQERSHEHTLNALQSSLTAEQLEHIEGIFSREREAQRASMELMRAQGADGNNVFFATGSFGAPVAGVGLTSIETKKEQETNDR